MNQQNGNKKTEEILEELSKILDKLTSKDKSEQKDEFFKKVDDLKKELDSVSEKAHFIEQSGNQQKEKEQKVEEEEPKIEPVSPPIFEKMESSSQPEQQKQKVVEIVSTPVTEKMEVNFESKQQEVAKSEEKKQINTMVIYPSAVPNSKDEFFNNMNSTLSRMYKNKIELLLTLCIEYTSFEKDLLLQQLNIIEKIKLSNIKALFLIINERTSEVDEFIKKISSYISVVKVITFKELKMKSTYLDISIDLLLMLS